MKVRLNNDCPYNKITVSANGMVITIGKEWTYVPNEQFLRPELEVEGQEKIVFKEQPVVVNKEPEKIIEKPFVLSKTRRK